MRNWNEQYKAWMFFGRTIMEEHYLKEREKEKLKWQKINEERKKLKDFLLTQEYKVTLTGEEYIELLDRGCSCCDYSDIKSVDDKLREQLPKELR